MSISRRIAHVCTAPKSKFAVKLEDVRLISQCRKCRKCPERLRCFKTPSRRLGSAQKKQPRTASTLRREGTEEFDATRERHAKAVADLLADGSKSLQEKQAAIAALDRQFAGELQTLQAELEVNAADMARVREGMKEVTTKVADVSSQVT